MHLWQLVTLPALRLAPPTMLAQVGHIGLETVTVDTVRRFRDQTVPAGSPPPAILDEFNQANPILSLLDEVNDAVRRSPDFPRPDPLDDVALAGAASALETNQVDASLLAVSSASAATEGYAGLDLPTLMRKSGLPLYFAKRLIVVAAAKLRHHKSASVHAKVVERQEIFGRLKKLDLGVLQDYLLQDEKPQHPRQFGFVVYRERFDSKASRDPAWADRSNRKLEQICEAFEAHGIRGGSAYNDLLALKGDYGVVGLSPGGELDDAFVTLSKAMEGAAARRSVEPTIEESKPVFLLEAAKEQVEHPFCRVVAPAAAEEECTSLLPAAADVVASAAPVGEMLTPRRQTKAKKLKNNNSNMK